MGDGFSPLLGSASEGGEEGLTAIAARNEGIPSGMGGALLRGRRNLLIKLPQQRASRLDWLVCLEPVDPPRGERVVRARCLEIVRGGYFLFRPRPPSGGPSRCLEANEAAGFIPIIQ